MDVELQPLEIFVNNPAFPLFQASIRSYHVLGLTYQYHDQDLLLHPFCCHFIASRASSGARQPGLCQVGMTKNRAIRKINSDDACKPFPTVPSIQLSLQKN